MEKEGGHLESNLRIEKAPEDSEQLSTGHVCPGAPCLLPRSVLCHPERRIDIQLRTVKRSGINVLVEERGAVQLGGGGFWSLVAND